MTYSLHFVVPATTRLEAITEAVARLRQGVRLIAVLSAQATAGPYWDVSLKVAEDA